MTSYKTVLVVSTLAICAILASACSDGPPEEKAFSGRRDSVATGIRQRVEVPGRVEPLERRAVRRLGRHLAPVPAREQPHRGDDSSG